MSFYTLRNLRVPVAGLAPDLVDLDSNLKPFIATECGVPESAVLDYQIANKGVDARIKAVFIGYTVHVELSESPQENEKLIQNDSKWMFEADIPAHSPKEVPKGVIVVGTGPAGLCAAWLLAHYGCEPVVIDRGFDVDRPYRRYLPFHGNWKTRCQQQFSDRRRRRRGLFRRQTLYENQRTRLAALF